MAIKGKNRSKRRTGAPRRKPVGSPRAPQQHARPAPWYRTMTGQLAVIVTVLALVGVVMWQVGAASDRRAGLESRQAGLGSYTDEVEGHVNAVQETVREMLGAPFNTANPEGLVALNGDADGWVEDLEANAAVVQGLVPPDELVPTNVVLQQSFLTYLSSAKLYRMAAQADGNRQIQDLLDRAGEVRDQAGVMMGTAIGMLDRTRTDADMGASGIDTPAQMTPILPSPAPQGDAGDG